MTARATVRRPTPSSNVLRRLMEDFDASTPDGMVQALADLGVTDIHIDCRPRRGGTANKGHGTHAVTWRQDGSKYVREGASLATALRAALRAARARCARAEP